MPPRCTRSNVNACLRARPRAGTFAALLAQNAFTNVHNMFEAEYGGFCAVHTGNQRPAVYDLTQINKDWGRKDHTEKIRFKIHECCC